MSFGRDVLRRKLMLPRERHRSCRVNHSMHREPVTFWTSNIVTRSVPTDMEAILNCYTRLVVSSTLIKEIH